MLFLGGVEALFGEEAFLDEDFFLGDETGIGRVLGEERIGSSWGSAREGVVSKSGSWKEVGSGTGKSAGRENGEGGGAGEGERCLRLDRGISTGDSVEGTLDLWGEGERERGP